MTTRLSTKRSEQETRRHVIRCVCASVILAAPALAQDTVPLPDPVTTDTVVGELEAATEALAPFVAPGEIMVTATRSRRDTFDLPRSVTVITRDQIAQSGSFVALRALSARDAGVWYDERASTTVDPIIRGFAGFNLLTLVDGNTLSTLWGEGGFGADDMFGKLDPEMIERIEVIRGPGSALYGSNALGAVINVITRSSPFEFTEEGVRNGWRVKGTVQSVANAGGVRVESFGATPRLRWLLGGSARDFDDIRGGGNLGKLTPSDGAEQNWDFSGEFRIDPSRTMRLTVQDVHRTKTKRYYRPTQDNTNDREAIALFYADTAGNDFFDTLDANLYWQKKRDSRRFFDTNSRGEATTETWQGGVTGTRELGGGHILTTGFQIENDEGDSPDDEQFTFTRPRPKRRDAPLSDWWDYGVFVQDEWRINDRFSVTGSARYDYMDFETRVDRAYRPPVGRAEDDEISDSTDAWTGGLGAVYRATDELHVWSNWARGFRQNAPNFGVRQLGDGVLIPGKLLDETTSDNYEIGVKGRSAGWSYNASFYYSDISNWQGDLRSATYKGATWFDFNGNGVRDANEGYVKQVEGGDAWVKGIELNATLQPSALWEDIPREWSLWGSFAWNEGKVDATKEHPIREPMRHTQPTRALLGVRFDDLSHPRRNLFGELTIDMVDAFDDIPSDRVEGDLAWRSDPQDGTSPLLRNGGGTPGFTLFHLHAGIDLTENVRLRIGIENLFDTRYRAAHSRMDGPGRNFVASLDITF